MLPSSRASRPSSPTSTPSTILRATSASSCDYAITADISSSSYSLNLGRMGVYKWKPASKRRLINEHLRITCPIAVDALPQVQRRLSIMTRVLTLSARATYVHVNAARLTIELSDERQ